MSIMFAAPSGGGRPTNGNLYEFKAGIARVEPGSAPEKRKVVADKAKGTVYIKQTPDQLMHFGWKNRENGTGPEDIDLIIFPGDTEFIRIKECTDGRMYMLKFKNTSNDRRLFWLQETNKEKDEEIAKKVNEYLNSPPPTRTRAGGGATERSNALLASLGGNADDIGALGNMDQNQLMQLFSLMQGTSGGSDMLPLAMGNRSTEKEAAVDEPSSSADPLPVPIPVAPQSIGNPDRGTPLTAGGKKPSRIMADQLRSILSQIPGKPDTKDGAGSSGRQPRVPVELTDVINRSNVADVVEANADRLLPHLPDQEPITKDEKELKETLTTPQFRKATSEFGHGLQTGQMAPVLEQFQLSRDVVNAASTGNVLEFAKKLTAAESANKDVSEGAKKRRPADISAPISEINAQINAEAAAEETTESVVQEPSAKRGKTEDDDNMEMD